MFLKGINRKFTHGALKGRKSLLLNSQISSKIAGSNNEGRPYFTFMDRVKEAVRVPTKHLESYFEPQGKDYESQMPNTDQAYGNTAMVFNAYLTHNAIDMNTWHDMDNTVHSQFGTVDNPVLIFTTDSSWRIVICQGPGVEDDSHSHEKMFYFLREGPLNRCHICGQCFKLIRLKDEYSEVNDYYSFMFSSLTHFDVQEEDTNIPLHLLFGDRPSPSFQSMPATNVYIHVNPDDADHMLVDPAYKLQKLEEAHEKLHAMFEAYHAVEKQLTHYYQQMPIATSRTLYSNWWQVEKSIRKLDRWFLKVEKFSARQFIDPDNHERRENRMIERKRDRWTDNYTYFFGAQATEESQMYRDYFETDLELDPENEREDEFMDEIRIAETGEFTFDKYDFLETSLAHDAHEGLNDIVDKKLFKHKYRMNNDSVPDYMRKMDRVVERFLTRAENRDPALEANLAELFEKTDREDAIGLQLYKLAAGEGLDKDIAKTHTDVFRDYMLEEAITQYKDYFESDDEEQPFFEYIDELPNRDKLKFMDVYEDYTVSNTDNYGFVKIPRREYNPELSLFSNVALDLVDFKDRVLPLTKDAARIDASFEYQKRSANDTRREIHHNRTQYNKFLESQGMQPIAFKHDSGILSNEENVLTDEQLLSDETVEKHVAESHRDSAYDDHEETHDASESASENTSEGTSEGTSEDTSDEHDHREKRD